MIEFYAYSQKGKSRQENEDRIMVGSKLLSEGKESGKRGCSLVATVCDGVGGTSGGAFAAEIAANAFRDYPAAKASPCSLSRQLHHINRTICLGTGDTEPASTVAGLAFYESRFLLFNLGDTRIYSFCSNKLVRLSKDHTQEGTLALTGYLGGDGAGCRPYIARGIARENSTYLICSDGIYKFIPEDKLAHILSQTVDLEKKARAILRHALQNGSGDDVSIVLLTCTA